jgi:hypothetical protein
MKAIFWNIYGFVHFAGAASLIVFWLSQDLSNRLDIAVSVIYLLAAGTWGLVRQRPS